MVTDRKSRSVTGSPGARITALLAVIYGLGVAFLPTQNGPMYQAWLFGGAAVVGVLFVVFLLVPFLTWVLRGAR